MENDTLNNPINNILVSNKDLSVDEFLEQYVNNTIKLEAAVSEAIDYKVFAEYVKLKNKLQAARQGPYQLARFKILRYIISCVKNDPEKGEYFHEEQLVELKDAGKMLYKHNGMDGMRDSFVWANIPQRYHKEIDVAWDGIGEWIKYTNFWFFNP